MSDSYLKQVKPLKLIEGVARLAIVAGVLAFAAPAFADSTSLDINIVPAGSVVELVGPQHSVTAAPNTISRPVPGWYKLRASFPGYESWSKQIYINPTAPVAITGSLSPKSRFKAGLRSVFFPGWGHYYSERKSRGAVITALSVALLGSYLYLDQRADDKVRDYESRQSEFDAAESVEDQETLKPLLEDARRKAFDAETDKRNVGWVALGFYGYQILDAVIFFPQPPAVNLSGVRFGLESPTPGGVRLGATYEF